MPLLPPAATKTETMLPDLERVGIHYDLIASKAKPLIDTAAPAIIKKLDTYTQQTPDWYSAASKQQREQLHQHQALNQQSFAAVNATLEKAENIESFAISLLENALKKDWSFIPDVKKNALTRVTRYNVIEEIKSSTTQTLLQAALHNFEDWETVKGATQQGSYIWSHASKGASESAPKVLPITPEEFAILSRNLDIGGQYQDHLASVFKPSSAIEKNALKEVFTRHERHSLMLHADIALMKKHISPLVHAYLLAVATPVARPRLFGQPQVYKYLKLDDILFRSVIVFQAKDLSLDPRCILYIPGDPVSNLREYENIQAAHVDLLDKLKNEDYRRFFIQLSPQRQKLQLHNRLKARFEQGSSDLLRMQGVGISAEIFTHLYECKVEHLFDDARFLAVPTNEKNRLSLINRMEHYVETGLNILNIAAFFVPGLGDVMMVVFAAQLMSDAFHGIESWEQGDKDQAWAYTKGVLLNLAVTAAVGKFAHGLQEPPAIEISPVIEELDVIENAEGQTQLWKPELTPYEHDVILPTSIRPNELGLQVHQDKTYLPLEGKTYCVQKNEKGQYHFLHPTNPDAYQPPLKHNGRGAWKHTAEELSDWNKATFVRRLDPALAELSDQQTEQLLHLGGVDEDILRKTHMESLLPPALLDDSVSRFKINQDLQRFIRQMRAGDLNADPQTQLQLLVEEDVWPKTKDLRFLDSHGRTIAEYGNHQVTKVPFVQVLDVQLRQGDLLTTVLEALEEPEIKVLLGESPAFGDLPNNITVRAKALRERIAQRAEQRMDELFSSHYKTLQTSEDPQLETLIKQFPGLPVVMAQELIDTASTAEYGYLVENSLVPLRIAEEAQIYLQEIRLSRAYEGAVLGDLNPDTQTLILHSLEQMPGWSDQVRIEVRDTLLSGKVIDHIGKPDAPIRKILVKENNRYKTYDELEEHLHGSDDFYASILHALPDQQRAELGFPHTWQGQALKDALAQRPPISRAQLRQVLQMPPAKSASQSPMQLAAGRAGYARAAAETDICKRSPIACFGQRPRQIRRLLEELYPTHSEESVQEFLGVTSLGSRSVLNKLKTLRTEFKNLEKTLDAWLEEPPELISVSENHIRFVRAADKKKVTLEIKKCWQRQTPQITAGDGTLVGHQLKLEGISVGNLPELEADFSHVSSLNLKNMRIGNTIDNFLSNFPKLRWLNMEATGLRKLPSNIGNMEEATKIYLGKNRITLTPQTAGHINKLQKLKILDLSENPLDVLPDFQSLLNLRALKLNNTGIEHWPAGIENLPDLSHVDMRHNNIAVLPDGFFRMRAEQLRNVQLHGNPLTPETEQAVNEIRLRYHLPREARAHAPIASEPVNFWLMPELSETERHAKSVLWNALKAEPDSDYFFKIINDLVITPSYAKARPLLEKRVWRLIQAASENSELRETLFSGALEHLTCTDRALSLFSKFGFELLLSEAQQLQGVAKELAFLKLSKARVRLNQLNDIAETQIDLQRTNYELEKQLQRLPSHEIEILKPDEIEVKLVYQVDLSERLELPWQPPHMQFRHLAKITPEQIEEAYNLVVNQEAQPHGLAKQLMNEDHWKDYLESAYEAQIKTEEASFNQQYENLESLKEKQEQWADLMDRDGKIEGAEILEAELKTLARLLDIDEEYVFTGNPMLDEDYAKALKVIADGKDNIRIELTQKILDEFNKKTIITL